MGFEMTVARDSAASSRLISHNSLQSRLLVMAVASANRGHPVCAKYEFRLDFEGTKVDEVAIFGYIYYSRPTDASPHAINSELYHHGNSSPYYFLAVVEGVPAVVPAPSGHVHDAEAIVGEFFSCLAKVPRVTLNVQARCCQAANGFALWSSIPEPYPLPPAEEPTGSVRFVASVNFLPLEWGGFSYTSCTILTVGNKLYYVSQNHVDKFRDAWAAFKREKTQFLAGVVRCLLAKGFFALLAHHTLLQKTLRRHWKSITV